MLLMNIQSSSKKSDVHLMRSDMRHDLTPFPCNGNWTLRRNSSHKVRAKRLHVPRRKIRKLCASVVSECVLDVDGQRPCSEQHKLTSPHLEENSPRLHRKTPWSEQHRPHLQSPSQGQLSPHRIKSLPQRMPRPLNLAERHPELFAQDQYIDPRSQKRVIPLEVLCLGYMRTGTACKSPTSHPLHPPSPPKTPLTNKQKNSDAKRPQHPRHPLQPLLLALLAHP